MGRIRSETPLPFSRRSGPIILLRHVDVRLRPRCFQKHDQHLHRRCQKVRFFHHMGSLQPRCERDPAVSSVPTLLARANDAPRRFLVTPPVMEIDNPVKIGGTLGQFELRHDSLLSRGTNPVRRLRSGFGKSSSGDSYAARFTRLYLHLPVSSLFSPFRSPVFPA